MDTDNQRENNPSNSESMPSSIEPSDTSRNEPSFIDTQTSPSTTPSASINNTQPLESTGSAQQSSIAYPTPQPTDMVSPNLAQQPAKTLGVTIGVLAVVFAILIFPVGFILGLIAFFKGKRNLKLRILGIVAVLLSIGVLVLLSVVAHNPSNLNNSLISTQVYVSSSTNELTISYPTASVNHVITTVGGTPSSSDLDQVLCKTSQMIKGGGCGTYYFEEKVTAGSTQGTGVTNISQAVSNWQSILANGGSKGLVEALSDGSIANSVGSTSITQVNINGQSAVEVNLNDVVLSATSVLGSTVSYTGLNPNTPLDMKAYTFIKGSYVYIVQLSATSSYWQSHASEFTNILKSIAIN